MKLTTLLLISGIIDIVFVLKLLGDIRTLKQLLSQSEIRAARAERRVQEIRETLFRLTGAEEIDEQ